MKQEPISVRSIRDAFHVELKGLYDAEETNSILYILFGDFLGWPRTKLHTEPETLIDPDNAAKIKAALDRLSNGCPVQYITGKSYFNELQLMVNPSVLIPRPETAELALQILNMQDPSVKKGYSAIDIGTGSGCIAIYLKKHLPGIHMYATDISGDALSVARSNASGSGVEIDFYRSDILLECEAPASRKFSLVVSNPPYVTWSEKAVMRSNVKDYEPHEALFVPDEDPLKYYRAVATFASLSLEEDGLLWFEINEAYGNELKELLNSKGFRDISLMQDFHGRDRFMKARFKSR